jgi:hypothetical protein
MAAIFDGTSLMQAHMAGIGCDDALIRGQHGIDDHGIGLRAAREEINLAIRGITGRQYLLAGAGTDVIRAIAGHLHRIVVPRRFRISGCAPSI